MTCLCPHCGYDLAQDETIVGDGLIFHPRGAVLVGDREVSLTTREREVLHAILKGRGRAVPKAAIEERLGYEGPNNLVQVMVNRIRAKLGPMRDHLVTDWGRGYRWAV